MARTTATNFSGGLQFPYATAATDVFKKEDVQTLAQAVDQHDHTAGKGKSVAPVAGSITNAMLGSDVARASLLTNGGFEIWQRGDGPFSTISGFGPDRWQLYRPAGTDTFTTQRVTAGVDVGSISAAYCVYTSGTGGFGDLFQDLAKSDLAQLSGKTVSFSARVACSAANAVRLALNDGSTQVFSAYHPGGGTYQTLTVTLPVASTSTRLTLTMRATVTCNTYIDNACLVVGSQPADYAPLHPADDLARCLRYYEQIGSPAASDTVIGGYAAAASQGYNLNASFRAQKAVIPTVTKVGTWSVVNTAQPSVTSPTVLGFRAFVLSLAAGSESALNDTTTSQFTAESNP